MDFNKAKKRILEDIDKLNALNSGIVFSFEESRDYVSLNNHGTRNESCGYGIFGFTLFIEDYKDRIAMYNAALNMIELLIAGTKLLDPKSYHHMKEVA